MTETTSPTTLPGLCLAALRRHAKPDAVNHKRAGEWAHVSAETFIKRVRAVTLGLSELGLAKGACVALLSENRPEWSIADLAILSLGCINVPIYTTQAPDQVRYILEDAGARLLFISGHKLFKRLQREIDSAGRLETVVFFDPEGTSEVPRAMSLGDLEQRGAERDRADPEAYDRLLGAVRAHDLATIIYTSGTTGEPKGVMLTHNNFVSNILSISQVLPVSAADTAVSVLPLSHIFERTVFYVLCWNGVSVYYAASFDQVGEHLREVRPTIMTAVPRLFEKVYHRIIKQGMSAGGWKQKVFLRAIESGRRYAELKNTGQSVPLLLELEQRIADHLVFAKWRNGIGGRLRYFVSGGAPLSPALSYVFLAAGIPILQGYGMTETCILTANRPDDNRVGSVGRPFPGIEISLAPDGEILVRGQNVMVGYYNRPAETAAVLSADGWFKTGDVGRFDEEGRLYITDRKKELFKLSNGKYVAPQLIESLIKQSPLVSQAVVVGAGRKHTAALIVPDWEALAGAMKQLGAPLPPTRAAWSRDPAAIKIMQREIAALTADLADYERVRRVALLAEELTIDGGELTPTLKVKRREIDEKYARQIAELFDGDADASGA